MTQEEETGLSERVFHPRLRGKQAERLLADGGGVGSFLLRPSVGQPGGFTISVRLPEGCTHIRCYSAEDGYEIKEDGVSFPSVLSLVKYYMEHPHELQDNNGNCIALQRPVINEDPTHETWFHSEMGGGEAQRRLSREGMNGSFLVRPSTTEPGSYSIAVYSNDKVYHIRTYRTPKGYAVNEDNHFASISELIEYHHLMPLKNPKDSSEVYLLQPLVTTKVHLDDLRARVTELERETDPTYGSTGYTVEFNNLQRLDNTSKASTTVGRTLSNRKLNRYKNIIPYDDCRVVLSGKHDYVNATWLTDFSNHKAYIAAQGPLESTTADFWRMVWEQGVIFIIMTTLEVEKGRAKCCRYWPTSKDTSLKTSDNRFEIKLAGSVNEGTVYHVRKLILRDRNSGEERVVWHYQYLEWPDHGVPEDTDVLLKFVNDFRRHRKTLTDSEQSKPLLVHCSAGIGRSGTVIAIDMLLNEIEQANSTREVNIYGTVAHIRTQRAGLVQTEGQYKTVYRALLSYVETPPSEILKIEFAAVGM
eukprot:Clim_evm122s210 gene=Clim_evmTU122s210